MVRSISYPVKLPAGKRELDPLRAPVKKKRKLAELSCDAVSCAGLMLLLLLLQELICRLLMISPGAQSS